MDPAANDSDSTPIQIPRKHEYRRPPRLRFALVALLRRGPLPAGGRPLQVEGQQLQLIWSIHHGKSLALLTTL